MINHVNFLIIAMHILKKYLHKLHERHLFVLAGILFCIGILAATNLLLERDKRAVLAAESEQGKLLASMLERHLSQTLTAIDDKLDSLTVIFKLNVPQEVDGQVNKAGQNMNVTENLESVVHSSTHIRSISLLDMSGVVLSSSNAANIGRKLNIKGLGFSRELTSNLEPGSAQQGRDLDAVSEGKAFAGGVYVLPFAKTIMLAGNQFILLALVNPSSLFPTYQGVLEPNEGFAALFNYQSTVLASTPNENLVLNAHYPNLPMFASLNANQEFGQFRYSETMVGAEPDVFIMNFRAARKYPLAIAVGMSESFVINDWKIGSRNLRWLGIGAACFVLLYTFLLHRMMLNREKIQRELKSAKEAAEQASAAKGEFLSTMSHEIRTPLNAVIGMTGLLRATLLDSEQNEFTETIEESANLLLAIIDDILDFSKIDAGKMKIESIDYQLIPVIEGSLDLLFKKAQEKDLAMMCYIDPALPGAVIGDPARLRQILLNLLSNAIKFTPSGEILLSARLLEWQGEKLLTRFEVADTGIGIDAKDAERLFSPFTQADGSVTRRFGGTGLGLSICKRLLEMMGGTICFESELGQGARFWFDLPLQIGELTAADYSASDFSGVQAIVVEPNRKLANILNAYLTSRGMDVTIASFAREAAGLLSKGGRKKVILFDTRTADMNVSEFSKATASSDIDARFILLSHTERAFKNALEQGFENVLMQPIKQAGLFKAIEGALQEKKDPLSPYALPAHDMPVKGSQKDSLILLVEDNPMNQKVATRQLTMLGYAVNVVSNGQEALDAVKRSSYAMILMDCQMPVMDGFEATRRIRLQELASSNRVQIVAMTANAMQGDRERCLDVGMDDYLSKPILSQALADLLARRLPLDEPALIN